MVAKNSRYSLYRARRQSLSDKVKDILFVVCTLALIGAGTYTLVDTYLIKHPINKTNTQSENSNVSDGGYPGDEAAVSSEMISNYKTAPDAPRIISIPTFGVESRVLPMNIAVDGSIQAPNNIHDSGWYIGSVKPGQGGVVFIDGHVSGPTQPGVFANLHKLQAGALIEIDVGDGMRYQYHVQTVKKQQYIEIDMKKLLQPQAGVTKGLVIMTCSGKYNRTTKTYKDRTIVFAQQVDK